MADRFYKAAGIAPLNQGQTNALVKASQGLNVLSGQADGDLKNKVLFYKLKLDQIITSKSLNLEEYIVLAKTINADVEVKAVNPNVFMNEVSYPLMYIAGRGAPRTIQASSSMIDIPITTMSFKLLSRWASVSRTFDSAIMCLNAFEQMLENDNPEHHQYIDRVGLAIEELRQLQPALDECNSSAKNVGFVRNLEKYKL